MIKIFKMKAISIHAKNTTIALKMRKNARNNEINLIIKIVAMKLFIYFYESRMKRAMTWKTTEIVIIMKKKKHITKNCFEFKQNNF